MYGKANGNKCKEKQFGKRIVNMNIEEVFDFESREEKE